jgi:hypothetical protein
MTDANWRTLLQSIKGGRCTPFLGAGVNEGVLPLGGQIAQRWAKEEGYPFLSPNDGLEQVAQFLAVEHDAMFPKSKMLDELREAPRPDFTRPDTRLECLKALAELPVPVFITTNYDDLMVQALRNTTPQKKPVREFCRWTDNLQYLPHAFPREYQPDISNPLVFHLHGSNEEEASIVLTEDDYVDFIVNLSRNEMLLPGCVKTAMTRSSILFIGYRLRDTNFRAIYRGLVEKMDKSQSRLSVTVQMEAPPYAEGTRSKAEKFMADYFDDMKICVYWGPASKFAQELRDRWKAYQP